MGGGGNQKTFHVPEVLLVRISDVFKSKLKNQPDEPTSTIILAGTYPDAFAEFLFWLYNQDTHEAFGGATASCYDDHKPGDFISCMVHLCILATKWKLVDLHNRCIEVLSEQDPGYIDATDLAIQVYDNTEAEAPLRRYITMIIHVNNAAGSSVRFFEDIQVYLKYDANDPTWSDRCKDYYNEVFRLGSYHEGEVLESAIIEPLSFEEYLMK